MTRQAAIIGALSFFADLGGLEGLKLDKGGESDLDCASATAFVALRTAAK